jgi:serine/threonine protein phosphatase PrpC
MIDNITSLCYSQFSTAGAKDINQDACGSITFNSNEPTPSLTQRLKGQSFALADGISSSAVSQVASDLAVKSFLSHYYRTPDTWTVIQSATTVIRTINASLYRKNQQGPYCYSPDRGYVCTFTAVIIKGNTAHIFHVGDACVGIFRQDNYDIVTSAHRTVGESGKSYLANALGFKANIDIEYHKVPLNAEDTLVMMTDGVHEHIPAHYLGKLVLKNGGKEGLAETIVQTAIDNNSEDNLTCQSLYIRRLASAPNAYQQASLPLAHTLAESEVLDGYIIERPLYESARSYVYQAFDTHTQQRVVIKTLSIDLAQQQEQVHLFTLEEWLARRINNPHVINSPERSTAPTKQYNVFEFVEGQTLAQWLIDNPTPTVSQVRDIIEQIAKGLNALHREGIIHQDIRPENIIISASGKCTIIDLGTAYVAGINELKPQSDSVEASPFGTALYSAPEYFLGDIGSDSADLFSLAVLTYYMLSGRYPYGTHIAKARTLSAQQKLRYQSVLSSKREIPPWIDATLKRALQVNPNKRFQALSEFIYHLHHPMPSFLNQGRVPLMEKHPTRFWQGVSALLALINCALFVLLNTQ